MLRILYQDDDLVAIDKPDGVLVHRTRIARDHVFVLQLLRDQVGRFVYPVHRLDRPTSGVLLFALSSEMAAGLVEAFTTRAVDKRYLAVLRGHVELAGRIEHALREEGEEEDGPLRDAVTVYTRIAAAELPFSVGDHSVARCCLVEAHPETGRMHQLRRHFKHLSHPVIGDTQHGDGRYNRLFREQFHLHRLLLHAWRMSVPHPRTGVLLQLEAAPSEEFRALFGKLGWTDSFARHACALANTENP